MKTTDVYISTLTTEARDEERERYEQIRILVRSRRGLYVKQDALLLRI